jgi:hypothetical protein
MSAIRRSRIVRQPASRPRASPITQSGTRVRERIRFSYHLWKRSLCPTRSIVTGTPSLKQSGLMKPIEPGSTKPESITWVTDPAHATSSSPWKIGTVVWKSGVWMPP